MDIDIDSLIETNKRLNRRCQKAEAELAAYKRTLRGKIRTVRWWQKKAKAEKGLWRSWHKMIARDARKRFCHACIMQRVFNVDVYSIRPFASWFGSFSWRLGTVLRQIEHFIYRVKLLFR